jgi:peptide/nickel transport system ATP-binding protein
MTIGRQLGEVTDSTDETVDLLHSVGINDAEKRLRRFPHELSGGQQQRAMIAMAIAAKPALVVADEPTTALDVSVQAGILTLIKRLRDDIGCSFVFVTHDLSVAAEIADRIAVMYAGQLLEVGTVEGVLERPAHPYTVGLLSSQLNLTSPRDHPVTTLRGEVPDAEQVLVGCPFAPRCDLVVDACTTQPIPLLEVRDGQGVAACLRLQDVPPPRQAAIAADAWLPHGGSAMAAIEAAGITKTFRVRRAGRSTTTKALRGIDLTVRDGESIALVGESGSGKTTLMRILAGLEQADAGSLTVNDAAPQMVFQNAVASLTPWLSVGEQVGERLRRKDLTRTEMNDRVHEALARVGLPAKVAHAKPRQLSGGQAQRVAIARAIVDPPTVLLADEATSSLDISLRAVVLNLLNRLRRELGFAVVFVTHDLVAARVIADRIAVMCEGEIVEIGDPDQICSHPRNAYTRRLLASLPGEAALAGEGP